MIDTDNHWKTITIIEQKSKDPQIAFFAGTLRRGAINFSSILKPILSSLSKVLIQINNF
jgi:hypothetical protein